MNLNENYFKETLKKSQFHNVLKCKDATHLVSEVIIGSYLDISVEYEHNIQEKRTDVEGILHGAIDFAVCKLKASGDGQIVKHKNLDTTKLQISIKGSLKQQISISNVSN